MRILGVILTLVCGLCPAWAGPKVAVLEAIGPPNTSTARLMSWTDAVRGVVLKTAPAQYVVLTRSNIEAFLPPGLDLADCEGECEITTARKIGAEYVVGVRVVAQGESWAITVGLHAAIDGRLLGQGRRIVSESGLDAGLRAATKAATAAWTATPEEPAPADRGQLTPIFARPFKWIGAPVVRVTSQQPLTLYRGRQRIGRTPVNVLLNGEEAVVVRAEALGRQTRRFKITTGGASGQVRLSLPSVTSRITFAVPWPDVIVNDGGRALRGRTHHFAPGRHTFRIIHPCANPAPFEVDLAPGRQQKVKMPHPTTCGRLRLEASAEGAEVRWEGRWRALPLDIPAGQPAPHEVAVRAPDHHDLKTRITRPPSGTRVHRFEMAPLMIKLRVDVADWMAKPCRARVEIDGVYVGMSPWTGELAKGEYEVETGCAEVVRRTVTLRTGSFRLRVIDIGPSLDLMLSSTALDTSTISLHAWNSIKRGHRFRFGGGIILGGVGYRGNPGFGGGLDLGVGLPLSPRYELAGFGAFGVASRPCTLEKSPPPDRAPKEVCAQVFAHARAVVRVHLRPLMIDAGWAVVGRASPSLPGESRHGPHLGVGWIF
ncbi:MAG: hypothetical protein ACI9U2_001186 [Bradymonadia bacterium]|jgi:hypothetical protein